MLRFRSYASGSTGNLYTLDDGESKILIEMGLPIKKIKQHLNYKLSEISFALLSHVHADHSKAVYEIMRAGIDVYSSAGTFEELEISGHRAKAVEAGKQIQVGTWTVLPFEIQHDANDPLGFLIVNQHRERFIFATDTAYIKNRFAAPTIIAVECNYSRDILKENMESGEITKNQKERIMQTHFGLENVLEFLEAQDLGKLQEIHLLHLSNRNANAGKIEREVKGLAGVPVYIAGEE